MAPACDNAAIGRLEAVEAGLYGRLHGVGQLVRHWTLDHRTGDFEREEGIAFRARHDRCDDLGFR